MVPDAKALSRLAVSLTRSLDASVNILLPPMQHAHLSSRDAIGNRLADRIAASRFSQVDRRALGEDKVRTLERR
jgi:hypothetical protein